MILSGAVTIALALALGAGNERLLLCRPQVLGDPSLARAEALGEAARRLTGRFLDYGAICQDAGEGARAARRAGLTEAVVSRVEGTSEQSRYQLQLTEVDSEGVRAQRLVEVRPGEDAVRPLRGALGELLLAVPPRPGPDPQHVAAWTVTGAGAAVLALGVLFAAQASSAARRADRAGDPATYARERREARGRRGWSAVALGAGGAAVAAGLTWRFVF